MAVEGMLKMTSGLGWSEKALGVGGTWEGRDGATPLMMVCGPWPDGKGRSISAGV